MSYNNLPMISKILILLGMLGLVSVGAIVFATSKMDAIDKIYSDLGVQSEGMMAGTRANRQLVFIQRSLLKYTIVTSDADNAAVVKDIASGIKGFHDRIAEASSKATQFSDKFSAIGQQVDAIMSSQCSETMSLAAQNQIVPAQGEMLAHCEPELQAAVVKLTALNDEVRDDVRNDMAAAAKETDSTIFLTYALVLGGLVLIMGVAIWLTRSAIVQPIQALTRAMEAMSKGQLQAQVPGQDRRDELGAMAETAEAFRKGLVEADRLRNVAAEADKANAERVKRELSAFNNFQAKMGAFADTFVASSSEVADAANSLSSTAEETSRQAQVVSGAAEEAATNVQTVAAATEEMSMSTKEINLLVTKSAQVALEASEEASHTETEIRALSEAAQRIGEVVNLINDIASQTNLLALNATIEAARAGDAGKGFAVVASEVKQLATQTAKATQDIGDKVNEIQNATQRTVGSIEKIVATIADIRNISANVATAVEQQGAATSEIASNTARAADGTTQVTETIFGVGRAAEMTGAASTQLMGLSGNLSQQASDLQREVHEFVQSLRAG